MGKYLLIIFSSIRAVGSCSLPLNYLLPTMKYSPSITMLQQTENSRDTWETPQEFFDELDAEFHFTLDPCCVPSSAKCKKYYTPAEDGLSKDWSGETVFMNPPYGKPIAEWMKKAADESRKPDTKIVALVPARTDTKWFWDYVLPYAEVRFIKGRLKFGGSSNSAPFASILCIYD